MGCAWLDHAGGTGFICGSGVVPCSECGGTCDLELCDGCRYPIGPDRDLCPLHRAVWEATGVVAELPARGGPGAVGRLRVERGED
jgi:hypothetical protein